MFVDDFLELRPLRHSQIIRLCQEIIEGGQGWTIRPTLPGLFGLWRHDDLHRSFLAGKRLLQAYQLIAFKHSLYLIMTSHSHHPSSMGLG